jgi:outer membrane receptor for Fe3+-dicitrate
LPSIFPYFREQPPEWPQNRLANQTTNEKHLNRQLPKNNLLWAVGESADAGTNTFAGTTGSFVA